jgi:2-amino-4-hydroxy-6-hydroxymethyldihydropteridine diphosphokinase
MTQAFVGMGSNRGDRTWFLCEGVRALAALPKTRVAGTSSVYATEPVGDPADPPYLNLVARLETDLDAEDLLCRLLAVERDRGRGASGRRGPRTLDLDLLYYGRRVIDTPRLTVPHPRAQERLFVLVPMAELDPSWTDPRTGLRVDALLRARPRSGAVRWAGRLPRETAEPVRGGSDAQ